MTLGFNIQSLSMGLQSDCSPANLDYLFKDCCKWNDCDRRTIRPYVTCRLSNDIALGLYNNWQPGDILMLGDSLTDLATAFNFTPILPRAFNAGITGSRISDVIYALDSIEAYFSTVLFRPLSPSELVVRVGTNDLMRDVNQDFNLFTSATQGQYATNIPPYIVYGLFPRLGTFQQQNPSCEIVICSIPPGLPPGSICCSGNVVENCSGAPHPTCPDEEITGQCIMYNNEAGNYRQAVIDANNWLGPKCGEYGFTFYDDHNLFLANPSGPKDGPLNLKAGHLTIACTLIAKGTKSLFLH